MLKILNNMMGSIRETGRSATSPNHRAKTSSSHCDNDEWLLVSLSGPHISAMPLRSVCATSLSSTPSDTDTTKLSTPDEISTILSSLDATLGTIDLFTELFTEYPTLFESSERLVLAEGLVELAEGFEETLKDVMTAGDEINKVIKDVENGEDKEKREYSTGYRA